MGMMDPFWRRWLSGVWKTVRGGRRQGKKGRRDRVRLVAELLENRLQPAAFASYFGGTYSQNFDTLPSTGSSTVGSSLTGNGPWDLMVAPFSYSGVDGWAFAHNAVTGNN